MKVLVFGQDPSLFNKDSESFGRVKEYAGFFDEFHIISATPKGFKPIQENNLFLWPTNSMAQIFRIADFLILGSRVIRRSDIHLIDAQDAGEAGLAAFFLSCVFKIPFRVQIHTDIFSPYFRRASWKELLRFYLAKFLIPRANCTRVVSERIQRSLISNFKNQILNVFVLPIFTDVTKFLNSFPDPITQNRFKNYDFKMIAVGRFVDKEKNFSMLIEMMRDFVKICPKAILVIVGDGPDRKNYKLQITNYKLENHVIIEEWRNDLESFYRSFDVFLLSSNYEGWGRTVIEAMASGLAVIMTDVGLAGEIAVNEVNSIVVPVGDLRALEGAVKDIYKNQEKRLLIAGAGQKTLENRARAGKNNYLSAYKKFLENC